MLVMSPQSSQDWPRQHPLKSTYKAKIFQEVLLQAAM
jgi:hypothetical protein